MMRALLIPLLLSAALLSACKESGKPSSTETVSATMPAPLPAPESSLGKEETSELMNMISAYYSLKDALVATNGAKADESASKLMSAAELFSAGMGSMPQHTELHPQIQAVMNKSEAIMRSRPEAIEEKRTQFAAVSDAMYKIATIAKLQHAGVYRQFCPMAMNDKGAYWLSAESEIKNPYFGKKMLECGEVKDSL